MNQVNSPLVSVIIPVFNSAAFISETIESVKGQSYKNWELIIIDDCSNDKSMGIAEGLAHCDPRIRIFAFKNNSGRPAVPRNFGIRVSKGQYVSFLDSDDLWLTDKLQKQVEFMEANKDIFLVYAKCLTQKSGKTLPKAAPLKPKSGEVFNELFMENFIPCLTVMMRNTKNFYFNENIGFKAAEDYLLWLDIAAREKIGFIDEPLAIYRMHENNISKGAWAFFMKNKAIANRFKKSVSKALYRKKLLQLYWFLITAHIKSLIIGIRNFLERVIHAKSKHNPAGV